MKVTAQLIDNVAADAALTIHVQLAFNADATLACIIHMLGRTTQSMERKPEDIMADVRFWFDLEEKKNKARKEKMT